MTILSNQHCSSDQLKSLSSNQVSEYLKELDNWDIDFENNNIVRTFKFNHYEDTVNFVNAVAEIATNEDHHPEISFGYNTCKIIYTTHKVNGLSINDMICASKIDLLYKKYE